jgi:CheY-like chemotaxis protein/nitrogen-specific signal transduction histidine kinase
MFRARQRAAAHQAAMQERLEQVTAAFGLANAELSRAARVSDQFLANMSHELRTPLNTILGMSQALQEGVMGPVNDDQMSYLLMVEKAGRHLLTMLTDILTLSKAGAGRLDMTTGPVAAQALCQECMQFVIQPARQKHMKVELKCDPRAAVFEADENILKQILVNLLTNAVKFTGERGALGLDVKVEPERQTIEFCVWDNGVGIAPENLGRLFQPFVQLNDGLARLYPGTGLGLSLIYKLTELHAGSVAVESEPDKGSRFMVRLPWQDEPLEAPASGTGALTGNDDAPRILLVEDNELSIVRMQRSLESGGYRVTVARQGAEALERAAEEKPAVMVVDLQLAGMNGWAVIKHVRANPKMADVPIAGTTAMVIPGDRERCLQAGADEYLIKPICRAELLAVVAGLIKKTAEPAANGGAPAQ